VFPNNFVSLLQAISIVCRYDRVGCNVDYKQIHPKAMCISNWVFGIQVRI